MPVKKVVIVDGAGSGDSDLSPILGALSHALESDGAQIETFPLREIKLAHCLGCFGCWVKTPGMCVEADAGREIAKAIVRSDVTVFFTPVTFGGYSPELKKMVDHMVQIASPYFQMDRGEVHHPPRYTHRPRLMMVGVQRQSNPSEARIFKTLAGRNAINFHPPSFAAEVVVSSDSENALRERFQSLLNRSDSLPYGAAAAALMPQPVIAGSAGEPMGARRALFLVGSPRTHEATTSGALAGFLADRLQRRGWATEALTLRASLNRPEGESELLSAVERAGLILLVFPLYVDSLPHLATKALAIIRSHRQPAPSSRWQKSGQSAAANDSTELNSAAWDSPRLSPRAAGAAPQRFVAIVNSGFPETLQNAAALAICREFAAQSGLAWAGGLALGGGGIVGGRPLTEANPSRPPFKHIIAALEMTAASLAEGLPVPALAVRTIAKPAVPIPFWNRLYVWIGGKGFEKEAAKNGVAKRQLLAQPYAV